MMMATPRPAQRPTPSCPAWAGETTWAPETNNRQPQLMLRAIIDHRAGAATSCKMVPGLAFSVDQLSLLLGVHASACRPPLSCRSLARPPPPLLVFLLLVRLIITIPLIATLSRRTIARRDHRPIETVAYRLPPLPNSLSSSCQRPRPARAFDTMDA